MSTPCQLTFNYEIYLALARCSYRVLYRGLLEFVLFLDLTSREVRSNVLNVGLFVGCDGSLCESPFRSALRDSVLEYYNGLDKTDAMAFLFFVAELPCVKNINNEEDFSDYTKENGSEKYQAEFLVCLQLQFEDQIILKNKLIEELIDEVCELLSDCDISSTTYTLDKLLSDTLINAIDWRVEKLEFDPTEY